MLFRSEQFKLDKLDNLRKTLWISYIETNFEKFEELKTRFNHLEERISKTEIEDTPWQEALEIFNNRFTVPFRMEVDNLKSSIIGESLPSIIFSFCRDENIDNLNADNWAKLNRESLEDKNVLSQGEKRALYLLNIIFDIEKIKREGKKTLLVIDDIADSFDYKNKYAIIEYLKDMSDNENFFMIIMSHNFDFYRTVSSRLNVSRKNKFRVYNCEEGLAIKEEKYQKQPFHDWRNNLDKKNIVALIPFLRNLIEYGHDKQVNEYNGIEKDYLFLTSLLHLKDQTKHIKVYHLKRLCEEYIGKSNFKDVNDDEIGRASCRERV